MQDFKLEREEEMNRWGWGMTMFYKSYSVVYGKESYMKFISIAYLSYSEGAKIVHTFKLLVLTLSPPSSG